MPLDAQTPDFPEGRRTPRFTIILAGIGKHGLQSCADTVSGEDARDALSKHLQTGSVTALFRDSTTFTITVHPVTP